MTVNRWTKVLLDLATDPLIAKKKYGFSAKRQGLVTYSIADPFGNLTGPFHCCVSWTFEAIVLGHRMLDKKAWVPPTKEEWMLSFLWKGEDERGVTLMAHERGVASKPTENFESSDPVEGDWYVCQGFKKGRDGKLQTSDDTGHSFFIYVDKAGLITLEANGIPTGGSVFSGLDGVGSREAKPRNARRWPTGNWPSNIKHATIDSVNRRYDKLWTAKLI